MGEHRQFSDSCRRRALPGLLSLALSAGGLGQAADVVAADLYRVAESAEPCLSVRASPDREAEAFGCLPPGAELSVQETSGEWARARHTSGVEGWLELASLQPVYEDPAAVQAAAEAGQEGAVGQAEEQVAPEAVDLDRITFEVPFPQEQGGGVAEGSADKLEYQREDLVVATGGVEFRYRELKVQAHRVEVELSTSLLRAQGDVVLDEGPRRLTGETLEFDLKAKTGVLTEAKAFVDPDIYFTGKTIAKVAEATYTIQDGMVTSCSDEVPDWSFRLSRARVTLEGYARIRNTRMRVKKVPLLYTPYILYPAKTTRTSGLLFPQFGYSNRRGGVLSLAYFQTLGDSYDATVYTDLYTEDFLGMGLEFRYRPSFSTNGILELYAIDDPLAEVEEPGIDSLRWKLRWDHVSDNLPWGMRGVVRVQDFSDFEFFRDFERDFNDITIRSLYSSGFVSGNWGSHSLNFLVDQRETFISQDRIVTQQQLPEIEYRLRPTQVGNLPLYVELLSSLSYLSVDRGETLDESYGRVDLFPLITVPIKAWPWLSVSLKAGERFTYYENSLNEQGRQFVGESLTRDFTTASAQIVGPSLSKVFEKELGPYSKFKHIIEPRWAWVYASDFEEQSQVPRFDEVDDFRARNVVGLTLVNRLLAKPKPGDKGEEGSAREILSFELSQSYSLDKDKPFDRSIDREREAFYSPISARLRFNTGPTRIESEVSYSTFFGGLEDASLSTAFEIGPHSLGLTWFTRFNPELDNTTSNQVRLFSGIDILRDRLRYSAQVNYDVNLGLLQTQRHVLVYKGACFGTSFEFWEQKSVKRENRGVRLAISLKNIGTFLDLTSGDRGGQL